MINLLQPAHRTTSQTTKPEAWFSPGEGCRNRIIGLCKTALRSIEVCVFTITDDRISEALVDSHRRGVKVRIITDNEKSSDFGSDIDALTAAGIPLRIDQTPHHMHHKFAIYDRDLLITGSYNWTSSAYKENEENIVVLGDQLVVARFQQLFEELWTKFA